jgi:molybdenum cofactor cytidylyltransferase
LKIVGLLLAAGSATRFGSDKLRHELPHGVSIAAQAARHLKLEIDTVIAVVRPGSAELAQALKSEGCEVVVCENAAEGMGASLACAARAVAHGYSDADGYLIALADMPFVRRTTIAAVRDALAAGAPLAAPYFRARRGHPVALSRKFLEQLVALKGDEGARALVAENERALLKIPVGDPGVIRDIDTPDDLAPPLRI